MLKDVENSILGIVLFPWIEGPPHISSRKSKWYLNLIIIIFFFFFFTFI